MRVAEAERRPALGGYGLVPTGERRLCLADFVGGQAIEEVIARIEGADMVEAQELPATFGTGQAIRARCAELARQQAAGMVAAGRIGAVDAAVQALRASRCFG